MHGITAHILGLTLKHLEALFPVQLRVPSQTQNVTEVVINRIESYALFGVSTGAMLRCLGCKSNEVVLSTQTSQVTCTTSLTFCAQRPYASSPTSKEPQAASTQ